jgi:hypothetical protein
MRNRTVIRTTTVADMSAIDFCRSVMELISREVIQDLPAISA